MEYWKFYYAELRKYADDEIDINDKIKGTMDLKPGIYFVSATGSFLNEWTGTEWKNFDNSEIIEEIKTKWNNLRGER